MRKFSETESATELLRELSESWAGESFAFGRINLRSLNSASPSCFEPSLRLPLAMRSRKRLRMLLDIGQRGLSFNQHNCILRITLHGLSDWHAKVPAGTRKEKIGIIWEVCTFYSIGRCPNSLWPSVVEGCVDGVMAPGRTVPTGTWNGPSQSGASRKESVTIRSTSLIAKPLWDGPFQVPESQ